MSDFWQIHPEKLTELKGLVDEGNSAGLTAKAMGLTRNMVLGKARRMGWTFKNPPPGTKKPKRGFVLPLLTADKASTSKVKADPTPVVEDKMLLPVKTEDGEFVTVENAAAHHCRYPYGDVGKDFKYCGRQAVKSHFCAGHARRCFQPKHTQNQEEAA